MGKSVLYVDGVPFSVRGSGGWVGLDVEIDFKALGAKVRLCVDLPAMTPAQARELAELLTQAADSAEI